MTDRDLLVVRRFFDELWSQGQLNVADELLVAHHVHHVSGDEMTGPEEVKEFVSYLRGAFPDLRFTIEDEVVAADKIVVRWTAQGTHLGIVKNPDPLKCRDLASYLSPQPKRSCRQRRRLPPMLTRCRTNPRGAPRSGRGPMCRFGPVRARPGLCRPS